MDKSTIILMTFLVSLATSACSSGPLQSSTTTGRDVLWTLASQKCVPNFEASGSPNPCVYVNTKAGYVLLKDKSGASQYLLIPAMRVSGIESPSLLSAQSPNYFAYAWNNRQLVSKALKRDLPDDDVGLAVNSARARTQDQFHIHIDCVSPYIKHQLANTAEQISGAWASVNWDGRSYHVVRMREDQFSMTNLLRMVAEGIPGAATDMAGETIFVTAYSSQAEPRALYVVERHIDTSSTDHWEAEDLLDHTCALGR